MVKEAIVTQADSFVDRPYSPMATRIYSGNSGEPTETGGTPLSGDPSLPPLTVSPCLSWSLLQQRPRVEAATPLRHGSPTLVRPGQRLRGAEHLRRERSPAGGHGEAGRSAKMRLQVNRSLVLLPDGVFFFVSRGTVRPRAVAEQRRGQHHLPDRVRETLRVHQSHLPEHAAPPDGDGLSGRLHMGSGGTFRTAQTFRKSSRTSLIRSVLVFSLNSCTIPSRR